MSLPQDITEIPYNELNGLIKRQGSSLNPDHEGGYGDIFIGYLNEGTGARLKVAIKVLRVGKEKENANRIKRYLIRETVVWQNLHHHNILNFLGLASDYERSGCPALISPYCEKGTVNDYLKEHQSPTMRFLMIEGVSEGLQYLHQRDVVHGDLKPSNILVHDDGYPLLCDFGRSKILTQRGFTTKPSGACRYQAPEFFGEDANATKATDVYAFALTSYEIWTGVQPLDYIGIDAQIILQVTKEDARPRYPNPAPLGTDALWKLFTDCWGTKPEERLKMVAVVPRLANISVQSQ